MGIISQGLLFVHVVAGLLSLVLFWVPVFTRKGGVHHRKIGHWYVRGMWVVAISALILSIENAVTGQINMALFLGFLSLITARPLCLGIECLNSKNQVTRNYRLLHLSTSAGVAIAGAILLAHGLSTSNGFSVLMIIFGILGISSLGEAFKLIKADNGTVYQNWLNDHIANMCASGIAAHTAFLVFGARSLLANVDHPAFSIAIWVAPSVIGLIGIEYGKRHFGSKRNTAPNTDSTASSP